MGPDIVTEDEFDRPPVLSIQSYINGELRQDSNTGLLIFDIPHVISELSQGTTLKAGTIILWAHLLALVWASSHQIS